MRSWVKDNNARYYRNSQITIKEQKNGTLGYAEEYYKRNRYASSEIERMRDNGRRMRKELVLKDREQERRRSIEKFK